MALNKLKDLNNHLFAKLERLSEEDIEESKIESEVKRAKAITDISSQIIKNAKLCLDAVKLANEDKIYTSEVSLLTGIEKKES